jgi:hypothetical protein
LSGSLYSSRVNDPMLLNAADCSMVSAFGSSLTASGFLRLEAASVEPDNDYSLAAFLRLSSSSSNNGFPLGGLSGPRSGFTGREEDEDELPPLPLPP